MANESELITATITVPRAIWSDVLEYAARRTADHSKEPNGATQSSAPVGRSTVAVGPRHKVRDLVAATNERGKLVYRMLAAQAGEPISIDEISKAVGFKGLQTPGLLGSMGRSMWSRGFRTALRDASGSWMWPDYGAEFPGGHGSTPPNNVVWGWDGGNRTLTMPQEIAAEFLVALA